VREKEDGVGSRGNLSLGQLSSNEREALRRYIHRRSSSASELNSSFLIGLPQHLEKARNSYSGRLFLKGLWDVWGTSLGAFSHWKEDRMALGIQKRRVMMIPNPIEPKMV
jgi:hypothetical protein